MAELVVSTNPEHHSKLLQLAAVPLFAPTEFLVIKTVVQASIQTGKLVLLQ